MRRVSTASGSERGPIGWSIDGATLATARGTDSMNGATLATARGTDSMNYRERRNSARLVFSSLQAAS